MNNRCTVLLLSHLNAEQTTYRHDLEEDTRYEYDILEFDSGRCALEWCRQITPDLILLDSLLTDMTGLQFLDALPPDRAVPVLMLIDSGDRVLAVEVLKRGAQEYICKDKITSEGLRRAVHTTIERSHFTQKLAQQQEQQRLIATIALHIRQSLDLKEILDRAVEEVRQLLQADRVVVCQFETGNRAAIVAESVLPEWTSLLNTQIDSTQICDGGSGCSWIEAQIAHNIEASALTEDYIQFLKGFQVQARLVVPILPEPEAAIRTTTGCDLNPINPCLWGVLIVHQCAAPRQWRSIELELLNQLATQLEIAIRQAELYQSVQGLNTQLEEKVQQRTLKLQKVNQRLKAEVATRKKIQKTLQDSQLCLRLIAAITTSRTQIHTAEAAIENTLRLVHQFFPKFRVRYCTLDTQDQLQTCLSFQPARQHDCTGMQFDMRQAPAYLALLRTRQPLIASDIVREPKLSPIADHLQQINIRAMLAVPLQHSGSMLGLLSLTFDQARRWSAYQVQAFAEIASFLSSTLHSIALQTQQQIAKQAQQASERKLRAIFNNTFQLTGLLTPQGILLEANQTALDFGGVQREAVVNRPFWETDWWTIAPETQQQLQQAIATAAAGEFIRYEVDILGANRTVAAIDFSLRPLKDELDQVVLLIAEGRDISARKRVEQERDRLLQRLEQHNQTLEDQVAQRTEALQQSEEKFRQLAENIQSVFWISDAHCSEILYVSPAYEAIWGRSCESLYASAQSFADAIHPEDKARILATFADESQGYDEEYRIVRPDGTLRWIRDRAFPILNAQGKVYRLAGIAEDITDRKQMEDQLRQSEAHLLEAQRIAHLGSWQFDIATEKITWSAETFRMFNRHLAQQEPTYEEMIASIHPDDRDRHEAILQWALEQMQPYDLELRVLRPDGSVNFVVVKGQPVVDETGKLFRFVGTVLDVTNRKQFEQQLRQTNEQLAHTNSELARATRLKDEFLANMSHELRTPLNAILGMTEGLTEEVFGELNHKQIKALKTIGSSGTHLLDLINDILDLAKIESGQMELDIVPTAVAPLCRSSITLIKQQALKKSIHLEIKLPADLPNLLADERRIRQVLINLLNNAVKFTPKGGRITLEVRCLDRNSYWLPDSKAPSETNHYLRFSIADTGIGIAPEYINELFQPFIQIDTALNRKHQGTGLGLSLVKRIVELHGGQVGLASEVGIGSCFTIDLPCTTVTISSPKPDRELLFDSEPDQPVEQVSPLILLAEDNEANIHTVADYLSAKGYRLLFAKDGLEAVAIAQSQQPNLILMDIHMPGIDGLEAMRQIRQQPQLADVPIIALTALAMAGDREQCLEAGANEYMTKPVRLKQLAALVAELLSNLASLKA